MVQQPITMRTVRAALQLPLPGRSAQLAMSVKPRPGDRPDLPQPCPHEAAVLILLYEREGQLLVPLTRRTESLRNHRGQVSLPGGAREAKDENLAGTAVRELCEELGVSPQTVELIGALTPLWVPSSSFCVYPFVAYTAQVPTFQPDAKEVADVIEAPLEVLLDPATRQVETRVHDHRQFQVPLYRIGPEQVWGATAMILGEFVALLHAAQQIEQAPLSHPQSMVR